MEQNINSVTSAETNDEVSANVEVSTSSPNNAKPNVIGSCRHEWKYNRTINVKVCTKCNYAENYSDLDNYR